MGTSSSFKGKVGNTLLPNDFGIEDVNMDDVVVDDENANDITIDNEDAKDTTSDEENTNDVSDEDAENRISWTTAKSIMSKYISSNRNIGSPKTIARYYIGAAGGASGIIRSSSKSRAATIKLGNIFTSFTTKGIIKTLEELGLLLKDSSLTEAMSKLVNYVHESAVSKNDVAIRVATANTLEKLIELNSDSDKLSIATATVLMQYFIADLIWQQMLIEYGYSFEKYGKNVNEAAKVEEEMKDYIKACVEVAFEANKDKAFTKDIYDTIMRKSLEIMEEA